MGTHPEIQQLKTAVTTFSEQFQRLRASNGYDDAEASSTLIPLGNAVVNLIKVAAGDDEIVDILTTAGGSIVDPITARVIVEYSWRVEREREPIAKEFSEWMKGSRSGRGSHLARPTDEMPSGYPGRASRNHGPAHPCAQQFRTELTTIRLAGTTMPVAFRFMVRCLDVRTRQRPVRFGSGICSAESRESVRRSNRSCRRACRSARLP